MKTKILIFLLTGFLSISDAQQRFADIGDFITSKGDTIKDCKIGYRLFGTLNSDSSNVIIFPTWFGGTSEHLEGLIAPNRFIDSSKYFAIAFDALGNGVSSSPSNYQQASDYPEIAVSDMVRSQYIVLSKLFGLKKIYGAVGGSMGGMQIFEWLGGFPGYISKAVAYVGTPKPSTYDKFQWGVRLNLIDTYRELGADEKQIQIALSMQSSLLARTPDHIAENISENELESFIQKFNKDPNNRFTVDNYRAQLIAMLGHDIYKKYNNSAENTISAITTELMQIVARYDHLVHPSSGLKFAELSDTKIYILENNCGHLAIGCELDYCSELIREFFD